VDEIAFSIHANGFFRHEPLLIESHGDRYVVVEGNRRLAACKLLTDSELRRAVGATRLPELSPPEVEVLRRVPVIVSTKDQLWRFVGYST
jgi:ParB-like chromosome segregation protein Spo0J